MSIALAMKLEMPIRSECSTRVCPVSLRRAFSVLPQNLEDDLFKFNISFHIYHIISGVPDQVSTRLGRCNFQELNPFSKGGLLLIWYL
jgi:hypothetical protein